MSVTASRFRDQRRTAIPEAHLVGRMLLQRVGTGSTGVKQARYTQLPTDYSSAGSTGYVRARSLHASRAYEVLHFSAIHWNCDGLASD